MPVGDYEVVVGEYGAELGARQAEYDAALAAHTELLANIRVGTMGVVRAQLTVTQTAAQHQVLRMMYNAGIGFDDGLCSTTVALVRAGVWSGGVRRLWGMRCRSGCRASRV